jgi:dihydroorotate dehydrogenase
MLMKSVRDRLWLSSSLAGGLSGAPLKDLSTRLIGEMYLLTEGKVSASRLRVLS